jgi:hypothetical protein
VLHGRGAECAVVDGLLARARRTEGGGALVVSAEPGMGKTALLEYAAARRVAAISHLPTPVLDAIRRRIFGLPAPEGRIA